MTDQERVPARAALRSPRAAAVAGIVFAVLLTISLWLLEGAMPPSGATIRTTPEVLRQITWALALVPFAGIAFLWFVGVVRDHLGEHEDRFLATVFLGSGLIYLAMTFTAAAVGAGLIALAGETQSAPASSELYSFGRRLMATIFSVYALRMSAVFMISLASVWVRSKVMPRWLALLTYALALVMLVSFSLSRWVSLIFPAWVLLISVVILVSNLRNEPSRAQPIEAAL
jgi:hypothetical protein